MPTETLKKSSWWYLEPMSVKVKIPAILRTHTSGERAVDVEAVTLKEALEGLAVRYPGLQKQVLGDEGTLHRFVNVYINDEDVRYLDGIDSKLSDGDTVAILPAVAGG